MLLLLAGAVSVKMTVRVVVATVLQTPSEAYGALGGWRLGVCNYTTFALQ